MTQSFYSTWMPNKDQSTIAINTDEIARKLEAAYGIKSGSIYISTIVITNGEINVYDRRRRHQFERKKHEIPTCNQFGSGRSIVEITIHIIYPARCGISMSCKKELADDIQARINAYNSSIFLEFKFDDGSFGELALTRCKKVTDSSLNYLLRPRRGAKPTTTAITTKKSATTTTTKKSATTTTTKKSPTTTTTKKSATTTTVKKTPTTTTKAKKSATTTTITQGKQFYVPQVFVCVDTNSFAIHF
ncbi:unnamed protein product [Rotaria sp. Silwood2]|nr:unnamed protein product [Rotaria sp. Silwood2]CAF4493096.1 unnamed protein product [Rotaria sp. Silwood2]